MKTSSLIIVGLFALLLAAPLVISGCQPAGMGLYQPIAQGPMCVHFSLQQGLRAIDSLKPYTYAIMPALLIACIIYVAQRVQAHRRLPVCVIQARHYFTRQFSLHKNFHSVFVQAFASGLIHRRHCQ